MIYFWIRFVAAQDKLWFWLELYSLVDYFTVPPSFVAIYLGRSWLGLRFMRALRLMTLPDVLQYLNILQSGTAIRQCQLVTIFMAIWLAGSGAIHLLENSGDPMAGFDYQNARTLTYGQCVYFAVVTMSTVGYGDIGPQTVLGHVFVTVFILFALTIFASYLPEIAEFLFSQSRYAGRFKKEHGKKHVVVCGDITFESVKNFLTDFLHKDREDTEVSVVFLNRMEPNLELQGLLKRHFTQVQYFSVSSAPSPNNVLLSPNNRIEDK